MAGQRQSAPERGQGVWYPQLAALPHPLSWLWIGGGNGRYHLTLPQRAEEIGITLARFARDHKLSLLVTPSRRTGDDNCQGFAPRSRGCSGGLG
ncbi:MAG: ELM1/GtrOC1 family putative glycosyltransferase [Alphaproteobacteria bacterium]